MFAHLKLLTPAYVFIYISIKKLQDHILYILYTDFHLTSALYSMQYKYSSFLCLLTALLYAIKHILSKFILRLLSKFLQVAMPFLDNLKHPYDIPLHPYLNRQFLLTLHLKYNLNANLIKSQFHQHYESHQ